MDAPSTTSLRHHITTRLRRPQPVDVAMIVAAAASYFHHINGAGIISLFVWWTIWAVLWVVWGRTVGSLLGAAVSLVVLAFMLVGPRTDLGFNMQRDCFEAKANEALEAHSPEPRRITDYQGDANCGLMQFSVQTQLVRVRDAASGEYKELQPLSVWFRGAGEKNWGLFSGNGMAYSPGGEPFCTSGVVGDTHGCRTESLGDGWYYYSYTRNLN